MKSFISNQRIVAVILAFMISFEVFPAFALDDKADDNPEITQGIAVQEELISAGFEKELFDSAIVARACKPFYFKNNVKKSYDSRNKNYHPYYTGEELLVPASNVKIMLDADMTYSSKSETFVFTRGEYKVTIRRGEDCLYINDIEQKYVSVPAVKTSEQYLLPFRSVAKALGMGVISQKGVFIALDDPALADRFASKVTSVGYINLITYASSMFDDEVLLFEGFESKHSSCTFTNSTGNSDQPPPNGITSDVKYTGTSSAYMDAVSKGSVGYKTSSIAYDGITRSYKVSFWAKASDDFAGNKMALIIYPNMGSKTVLARAVRTGNGAVLSNEWTMFEYEVNSTELCESTVSSYQPFDTIKDTHADSFSFLVRISPEEGANETKGRVYVDDLKITKNDFITTYEYAPLKADKDAAWYELGDRVTYKLTDPDTVNGYENIEVTVYAPLDEVVHREIISAKSLKSNGYSYTPKSVGYYEIEMKAISDDGIMYKLSDTYTKTYSGVLSTIDDSRHGLAVVSPDAKNVFETNERFFVSDFAHKEETLELARKVGFSGVRIHYIPWGDTMQYNGFQDAEGAFDWTSADNQINNAKKQGFNKIIANVFATPRWAVSEENHAGNQSIGIYPYNRSAPKKMDYVASAMKAFTERYKDDIDGIEFWNEPTYGTTAFWQSGVDSFRTMSETAHDAIKSVDEDMEFYSAGYVWAAASFLDEALSKGRYKDIIDTFSFHGQYHVFDIIKPVLRKHDMLENVNIMDSEGYYYSYVDQDAGIKDLSVNNMHYMVCMLKGIKDNLDYMAHFCIQDGVNILEHSLTNTQTYGLFSLYPYVEPHPGAVVAHNFIQEIGKEVSYLGEYALEDGQKAVSLINDGEPLVVVWNSDDKDFELSDTLKDCFTDNTEITDFYGRAASAQNMKAKTMYYIKGLSLDKLKLIKIDVDKVLNGSFARPFYTCRDLSNSEVAELDLEKTIHMYNPEQKPFDEETFELNPNLTLVSNDWKWIGMTDADKKPDGFNVSHTAHIDEDGLYLVIDVEDEQFSNTTGKTAEVMWQNDSVQIGLDTGSRNLQDDNIELQIGLMPDGVTLYKGAAPHPGAMIPVNYTEVKKTMPSDLAEITSTEKGMLYKIFIPTSELFPYAYPSLSDYLRISLLVNQNNGERRCGYMEWGSGIGGTKSIKQYAALVWDK